MSHDEQVAYRREIVTADPEAFSWQVFPGDTITRYIASGPCPACGARCTGSQDSDKAPLTVEVAEANLIAAERIEFEIQVPMECDCGFPHSKPENHGCGRSWLVRQVYPGRADS